MNNDNQNGNSKLNPFEEQLKIYFPEIYNLHVLAKEIEKGGGGEAHIWDVLDQIIEMNQTYSSGTIFIHYNKGKIDGLDVKRDHLAFKKSRPGF